MQKESREDVWSKIGWMQQEVPYNPDADCMIASESVTSSCPNNSSCAWFPETVKPDLIALSNCALLVVWAGRSQGSRRSMWRREERDECGKLPECFKCVRSRKGGETGSGTSEVASHQHLFHFQTFHASCFPGAQGSSPDLLFLSAGCSRHKLVGQGNKHRELV